MPTIKVGPITIKSIKHITPEGDIHLIEISTNMNTISMTKEQAQSLAKYLIAKFGDI